MWNLTPEYLEQAKQELKGRRAAIQALIEEELKSLNADIEEIETIERLAYAFAAKHLPMDDPAMAVEGKPPTMGGSQTGPGDDASAEKLAAPMASFQGEPLDDVLAEDPGPEPKRVKGMSAWRMRIGTQSASESV